MDCIIERITQKLPPIVQGEIDFARIQHKPEPTRNPEYHYRHLTTGAEYSWIEGAFAPSGHKYAGFAIVIAQDRHLDLHHGYRFIRVLEEFEARNQHDIEGLIKGCMALKKKYGVYPLLNQGFYTELTEAPYDKVINVISALYGEESEFWPIPGAYSEYADSWRQYFNTLDYNRKFIALSSLQEQGPKLVNYLSQVKKGKLSLSPEDNPAIAAFAYAVTALVAKSQGGYKMPETGDAVFTVDDEY